MKLDSILAKYGRQSLEFFGNVEVFLTEGGGFRRSKNMGNLTRWRFRHSSTAWSCGLVSQKTMYRLML